MSAPQPLTVRPPTTSEQERYERIKYNFSLGLLVVCPLIIALPPRKLDFYTFGLGMCWVFAADQVVTARSGEGILENLAYRLQRSKMQKASSDKAKELQERLERAQLGGQGRERGMVDKLWMGQEGENWKEKRMREEREAFEAGKGYSGIILDQIWEVWNGGKPKEEASKEESMPAAILKKDEPGKD